MREQSKDHLREKIRRPDLRGTMRKDFVRYRAREEGHGTFWRSLSILGGVGWPIVLLSVGGAVLGRWLDRIWETNLRMTLTLMFAGVLIGSLSAWHLIQGTRK
ncbi:MAG: AtpZ/AtpI family protein [Planctomycetaceae bacterium]|nr:AtpZ/AtpI family protein [Planctomycetaceae bacterium]